MENELFALSFTMGVMRVTWDMCLEALCQTVPKSEGMSPMEVQSVCHGTDVIQLRGWGDVNMVSALHSPHGTHWPGSLWISVKSPDFDLMPLTPTRHLMDCGF